MKLTFNYNPPLIMHIDLNSCFAMIEQQANPLIRYKPVAVAAYDSPGGMVLAASYEAKRLGIKLGVDVREARLLSKDVIVMMPDPPKYRDAHKRFRKVLLKYTSEVVPKSIDEFVIDFSGSKAVREGRSLEDIGMSIKQDLKEAIGCYVTVNVGIATNRFLAKTAAGFNKPDGLTTVTADNLLDFYGKISLLDLPGINVRYEARLNTHGIFTPLQLLEVDAATLYKQVFKSRIGLDWYARLRGWEVDSRLWGRKSFGHQYALPEKTTDREALSKLLMKLCEKTGRRLRDNDFKARGIRLTMTFTNREYWNKGKDVKAELYSTQDIFLHAQKLLNQAHIPAPVRNLSITVFNLVPYYPEQLGLFQGTKLDQRLISRAADEVNDKYGEFSVVPAVMANMDKVILDRIAWGNVKELYSGDS